MRFFANGPRIPDALLEERDNGNVVFFCGAGVSKPAGLPGFVGLAEQTIAKLGAPADAKSRLLLNRALQGADYAPPLDQIFQHLQQEYGAALVEDTVNALLATPQNASTDHHSTILRLSQNAARQPQVVTTNFDLLFETARDDLTTYVPPALPDLAFDPAFDGIVYLHGRRAIESSGGRKRQGLVLSSADFGRAYLADGWATKFVRDLLRNYVIVLVGYSATDPPVRYLLEGLHSRGDENSATIYAFDAGSEAEVQERWRDRGVHALAYPSEDRTHKALWDTLRAWAERSDDPAAWRRTIRDLARQGPRTLAPHQRGQVASLIRTSAGAKLFADSSDSPPAEWLCVFDKYARYAKPHRATRSEPEFDPLDYYGLDDDPPRPPADRNDDVPGEDFIGANLFDDPPNDVRRLAGVAGRWSNPLPSRLFYISRWLCNRLDDPALMWWASGYQTLHPLMLDHFEIEFERTFNSRSEFARRAWTLLLEKFRRTPEDQHDSGWYAFAGRLKLEGWSNRILRDLERVIQPHVVSKRPWIKGPHPPELEAASLDDIGDFEVHFPPAEVRNLVIPAEHLPRVFTAARRAMERASELLDEIGTTYWRTATLHAEQKAGEHFLDGESIYFHWVAALFDRLAAERPEFARSELTRWPNGDRFFFDKLKLYAWMKADVFDATTAAVGLSGLSDDSFWDSYHRRELLHTIRARWMDFSAAEREAIEARLLAGPSRYDHEQGDGYLRRRAITSAEMLGWLEQQNCPLSDAVRDRLPELRKADPRWRPSWDTAADDSNEGRSGWVKTEPSPAAIMDAPISQLAEIAQRNTREAFGEFVRYEPFAGLAKERPARALAGLAYEARHGRYPTELWQAALSNWPEETTDRLRWLAARRIARLPVETVSQLRFYIPDWMRKVLPALAKLSLPEALKVWDMVTGSLCKGGPKSTESGLGDVTIGGVPQNRSRRTYDHAINSPIGRMAETLFTILNDLALGAGAGLPSELKPRLERLLEAPGEGADHAILETTIRLRWLYYIDPAWVTQRLAPLFGTESAFAEPAWNGLLHDDRLPVPELFVLLKQHFLDLFEHVSEWNWDSHATDKLNQFLVLGCYWHQKDDRYVSYAEARAALQQTDDKGRAQAAWFLSSIVRNQNNWESLGKPFIDHAWPKEARFQTSSTSQHFALLAEDSGDQFPDVVRTILPILVPVPHLSLIIYRMKKETGEEGSELASKYPEPMLALLDRLVSGAPQTAPLNLAEVLNMIADASPGLRQDPRWRRLDDLIS